MSLETRINTDIKEAMKAKDQAKLRALRSIKSAILLAKTEKGGSDELSEEQEMKILSKMAKQRKDSLTIFQEQKRDDLAQKEQEELDVIQNFLPEMLSEAEIEAQVQAIITETGAEGMKDMGRVMGMASKKMAGKADGGVISGIVKKILAG